MLKKILMGCALILTGAGCTTVQPLTPFPQPPEALLAACERPQALPMASAPDSPPSAAQALQTVTDNYARHHRCADRADALQEWVRGQAAVRP